MNYIIKILIVALSVFVAAEILPGIQVLDFKWALLVAILLSFLNAILKPILVFMTIPATVVTLGLFLFVINACIILVADYIIKTAFEVSGFWWALLFSVLVSVLSSFIQRVTGNKKPKGLKSN
jgi:putative membrane protein